MNTHHLRTSRRDFLKTTTATAIVAPLFVTAAALGRDDKARASERLTLGFIGVGKQNRSHLGHFLGQKDVQVRAVCDVDTTRRESAKKMVDDRYAKDTKAGISAGCTAYTDFHDLLSRTDIDAVVIATPDHWHAIPVLEALKAGKDIYCEKPLTLTIHEAKLLIDKARQYNRVFQVGSQQRSSKEFWQACSLVRSGRIGKVQRVYVNVAGPSKWCDLATEKLEPGLDWDRWLGPAPSRGYSSVLSPRGVHNHFPNWRNYREYSGGMMTDWGAHHFDIAQWGLGMDQSGPVKITPPADPKADRGLTYEYANGVVMIHGAYPHWPKAGVAFVGTDGKIFVNRGYLAGEPEDMIKQPLGEKEVELYKSPGHQRDWLNCVRSRKRPICDVEVGARSVTVCHLGNLAYWYHRNLKWDPKAWEFVGDAEANQWRDRERRADYQLPNV